MCGEARAKVCAGKRKEAGGVKAGSSEEKSAGEEVVAGKIGCIAGMKDEVVRAM